MLILLSDDFAVLEELSVNIYKYKKIIIYIQNISERFNKCNNFDFTQFFIIFFF